MAAARHAAAWQLARPAAIPAAAPDVRAGQAAAGAVVAASRSFGGTATLASRRTAVAPALAAGHAAPAPSAVPAEQPAVAAPAAPPAAPLPHQSRPQLRPLPGPLPAQPLAAAGAAVQGHRQEQRLHPHQQPLWTAAAPSAAATPARTVVAHAPSRCCSQRRAVQRLQLALPCQGCRCLSLPSPAHLVPSCRTPLPRAAPRLPTRLWQPPRTMVALLPLPLPQACRPLAAARARRLAGGTAGC